MPHGRAKNEKWYTQVIYQIFQTLRNLVLASPPAERLLNTQIWWQTAAGPGFRQKHTPKNPRAGRKNAFPQKWFANTAIQAVKLLILPDAN